MSTIATELIGLTENQTSELLIQCPPKLFKNRHSKIPSETIFIMNPINPGKPKIPNLQL